MTGPAARLRMLEAVYAPPARPCKRCHGTGGLIVGLRYEAGATPDGRCPECGTPVTASVRIVRMGDAIEEEPSS